MNFDEIITSSEYRFQLKQLTLQNFRGFDSIDIDFEEKLTVFIGINGAGKTSILDAIASMLEIFTWQLTHSRDSSEHALDKVFKSSDLQNGKKEFICSIHGELFFRHERPKQEEQSGLEEEEDLIWIKEPEMEVVEDVQTNLDWLVTRTKAGYKIREFSALDQLRQFAETVDFRLRSELEVNLPVVAYFPVNATPSDWSASGISREYTFGIFETYFNALNGRAFDFRAFFEWFKWQENLEKQFGENGRLDAMRDAVYQMLNDPFEDEIVFDRLHVDWRTSPVGEFIIYKQGKRLHVNQFSSGEKSLVSLAAGIALRLIMANPNREKPLEGSGVVLIDEVDLHLHPGLERAVLPKLRRIFPNIQFVVTAHSPGVLQNVPNESVRVLENFKVRPGKIFVEGRDIESVSYTAFGQERYSRESFDLKQLVDSAFRLIDSGKKANFERAEKIISELEKKWGNTDATIIELKANLEAEKLDL